MPRPATTKMSDYRARQRARGLRPIQIWVPDVRAPQLAAEIRRQSLQVRRRKSEREALDFIESAGDLDADDKDGAS